jgi:hypothetical protein
MKPHKKPALSLKEIKMPDIPLVTKKANETEVPTPGNKIEVTPENAAVLTVHFLSQIHGRLGYIVKLLEENK